MNRKELREVCTFEPIRNALLVILDEGEYTSESIMQKLRLNPSEIISIKLISDDNNVGHAGIVFKEWGRIESVKQHIDITNNDFLTWKYAPVMDMSIRCLIDGS